MTAGAHAPDHAFNPAGSGRANGAGEPSVADLLRMTEAQRAPYLRRMSAMDRFYFQREAAIRRQASARHNPRPHRREPGNSPGNPASRATRPPDRRGTHHDCSTTVPVDRLR